MKRIKDIGEIGLIKRVVKGLRLDKSVVRGVGDDTAVIKWTKDKYLLFTCDMLIEDVHFKLNKAKPFQIGWKAIARNVSDIAAMGGIPRYALVSAGMNPDTKISFAEDLYKGIKAAADEFDINIVGGDTSRATKLTIDVSLIGEVEKDKLIVRSGARPGDLILVTGTLGGSMKGKHLNFMPRLKEIRAILKTFKINSMIDISDGLALDLWRILDESEAGGRIYQTAIPVSKDAGSFKNALYDGEDFEILFTMNAKEAGRFFRTGLDKIGIPVSLIGEITDKRYGYKLITEDGGIKDLKPKGYLHF